MTSTGAVSVSLSDQDLSAIYIRADEVSGKGQRRTKLLVRLELLSLIIASVAGVGTLRVGSAGLDIFAAVSAVFFLASFGMTTIRSKVKAEPDWYAGRAAAESVRTLAWRYAVGGDPFPHSITDQKAADRYLNRLHKILEELPGTELGPSNFDEHELTPPMVQVRSQDLATRRAVYKRDRIEDQLKWYKKRTSSHEMLAKRWFLVTTFSSALGVVAAGIKFFGWIDFDMLGVFASVASAAIAWNQLNQHRNLVSAYGLTARELNIVRDRIDQVEDDRWPTFVSDSEDAISREHTMWLARHGHPSLNLASDEAE